MNYDNGKQNPEEFIWANIKNILLVVTAIS